MNSVQREQIKNKILEDIQAMQKEIAFGRLMILPESVHCVACISELNL